ncbi:MAG TPA: 50S ribosomal protein L23 [Calditrichia bacterium]|nr:50S ribosomal protein L23 [Calditrichia bacterium]HQV31109.1 50S ribosomal protein L23 [Calditrichia bacterium]
MKDARTVILEPILTEKALRLRDANNQYLFRVSGDANKIDIKRAIQKRFSVTVKNVQVVNVKGKPRQRMTRQGRVAGFTPHFKKAIVSLEEGQSMDFLETV